MSPPFSIRKLGAIGTNLVTLTHFFESPWQQPVRKLPDSSRGFLLTSAGFCLHSTGRLREAADALRAGMEINVSTQDWQNAARAAANLSEVYLTVGDLSQSISIARQGVEFASRGGEFEEMVCRAFLADAMHQSGQEFEAASLFKEAETLQKQLDLDSPILFSLRGFLYCDLILSMGQLDEANKRGQKISEKGERFLSLLDTALGQLVLGQAELLKAQQTVNADFQNAKDLIERAVDGLRKAGTMHRLPRGLLTRAALYRLTEEFRKAEKDLAEVHRIASSCGMDLYDSDYHLELARLRLAEEDEDKAQEHLARAKKMINRMGYHRRDKEVAELEAQLG